MIIRDLGSGRGGLWGWLGGIDDLCVGTLILSKARGLGDGVGYRDELPSL